MSKPSIFSSDSLCGVIAARTASEAQCQIQRALRYTKTIEVRLDWLSSAAEIARFVRLLKKGRIPHRATLIATCRRREAGGKFLGKPDQQLRMLRSATDAGCQWIDIEIETVEAIQPFILMLYTGHVNRILSYHDFHSTPANSRLSKLARRLCHIADDIGFDVIKIATKCDSLAESLRLLSLPRQFRDRNIIAVPMGEIATPARILAPRFGSVLSYAPVEDSTAPGQISLAEMSQLYRSENLTAHTRVYGVIGDPIAHSLSPVLHNAGFRARKIDAIYLPFRVTNLEDFLAAIGPLGVQGFSITLPYKETLLAHVDRIDPLAQSVGAVNTIVVRGGKLFGYNTDCLGILRALEDRMTIRSSRILIFGAGGVARAAAFALAQKGASVSICARRPEPARKLARAVRGDFVQRADLRKISFDAIINATPVGMHPRENESPLAPHEINCRLAFDTVYRPRKTKFLHLAQQRGIKTVSGLEMFLAQGTAQWELWTGQSAPANAMRRAVLQAIARDERERWPGKKRKKK